jgi:polyisoprenoid-binding protein YceI
MKSNFTLHGMFIVFCFLSFGKSLRAQTSYTIKDSKNNNMKLSGTSSMHDWDMNAQGFSGEAKFVFMKGDNEQLVDLSILTFSLPVLNLKSDKKALDKNAYDALKTKEFKNILYKLISAKVSPERDGKFLIKTNGDLTIAGITKEITMDVYCVVNKDTSISCTGSDKLNMSDYKVKPPSFMFGAMKTGDAVTLDFVMVYTK